MPALIVTGGERMIFYEGRKVYMDGDYPAIFLEGKNAHIHKIEWIKHNGKIPKGYVVHHKDENKMNWHIHNLEFLTRGEHLKKHKTTIKRPGVKIIGKKDGLAISFCSIEKAASFCGTYPCSVRRVFNGAQTAANGWKFERV